MNAAKGMFARAVTVNGGFYIGLVVLAIVLGILTYYIDSRPYVVPPAGDEAALSKALDTYAAAGNLLTTLATGLLAGMGWFFTNRHKQRYPARDVWPAIAGALCACLSIYFGYISSQNVQWLIENSIGTLDLPKIQWPRNLQFYTLLLSVFSFADFVRRDWNKVDKYEGSTNVPTS
ncbi:MAG: hypothetical protein ACLPHI_02635 [Terriglobales bacterium]|jgi:hypothetical protein